jgi:acetylornithine aminotransferase
MAEFDNNVMGTYGRLPVTIKKGSGCTLTDDTGKIYLDFVAGIATCVLGHANPALISAVNEQMSAVHHTSNLFYGRNQGALAKWLCDNSCADKVFFCNSGAEANEAAIKLARKHASSRCTDPVIITAHNSFHGRTLATVTATAQPKYQKGFGYGGRMVEGFAHCKFNDIKDLKKVFKKLNRTPIRHKLLGRKRRVAAIMLEALQGEGGIKPCEEEFFKEARKLCDKHGALLICDEVQVGMGRSGQMWGYEKLGGVEPDAFTSAKALGGGIPIGALCAKASAAACLGPGEHGSTYGGNPLACAAGLAVAKEFSDKNILDNVARRGEQLRSGLEKIVAKHADVFKEVRGWGLLLGVEISDKDLTAAAIGKKCMEEGLLVVAAGPKVVRFVPPLVVTENEIERALEIFEEAVGDLKAAAAAAS